MRCTWRLNSGKRSLKPPDCLIRHINDRFRRIRSVSVSFTSKTGAALQDILNILRRRYPIARVLLFPVLVQGESAPQSIAAAIREASDCGQIDVMIVGRGGGSMEDLWAFNDEK